MQSSVLVCVVLTVWHLTVTAAAVPKWDKYLVEAEHVALQSSNFIVPVPALVQKIMRDLKTIRSQYHEMSGIMNKQKWITGELLARRITDDQIMQIENGNFGPLENVKKFSFGSLLVFSKAYHPEILSERLYQKYGVVTEPNTSTGDNSLGLIRYDQAKRIYTIEKGPQGYSYPGYRNRYVYKFTVADGVAKMKSSAAPGHIIRGSEEN